MIITKYTYKWHDNSKFDNLYLIRKVLKYNTKHIIKIIYLKRLMDKVNVKKFSEIDKVDLYYFSYKMSLKSFPELESTYFYDDVNSDYPNYLYDIIIRNKRFFLLVTSTYTQILTPKLFTRLSAFKNKPKRNLEFNTPFEEYMVELAFLNNLEITRNYFRKLYTFDKEFFIKNDS